MVVCFYVIFVVLIYLVNSSQLPRRAEKWEEVVPFVGKICKTFVGVCISEYLVRTILDHKCSAADTRRLRDNVKCQPYDTVINLNSSTGSTV